MTRKIIGVWLLTAGLNGFAAAAESYFYDDAGQLFRVLDSTGTLIEYDYDYVGNILATNRPTVPLTALPVLNMEPLTTGPGQVVAVCGRNFNRGGNSR
jgi:YD repeat-containing protein